MGLSLCFFLLCGRRVDCLCLEVFRKQIHHWRLRRIAPILGQFLLVCLVFQFCIKFVLVGVVVGFGLWSGSLSTVVVQPVGIPGFCSSLSAFSICVFVVCVWQMSKEMKDLTSKQDGGGRSFIAHFLLCEPQSPSACQVAFPLGRILSSLGGQWFVMSLVVLSAFFGSFPWSFFYLFAAFARQVLTLWLTSLSVPFSLT